MEFLDVGIREWGRGGRANWDGMRELGVAYE